MLNAQLTRESFISETISKLFKKINEEKKQTIVIVTHSNELAELTKDKYKIEKGNLKKI